MSGNGGPLARVTGTAIERDRSLLERAGDSPNHGKERRVDEIEDKVARVRMPIFLMVRDVLEGLHTGSKLILNLAGDGSVRLDDH